jgi:hypothetical protein
MRTLKANSDCGAPRVVGEGHPAAALDVGNKVAPAVVAGDLGSEVVGELRVRPVVHQGVELERHQLAVLVRGRLGGGVRRRTFPGVGDVLVVVVLEKARPARRHGGDGTVRLQRGAELVTEVAALRVHDEAQLFARQTEARAQHEVVDVEGDALGVDGDHAIFVDVGEADVRLDAEVGLALDVVFVLGHVGRVRDQVVHLVVLPFLEVHLEEHVGRSGMDLDGVVLSRLGAAHVGRQGFELDLYLGRGRLGLGLGLGGHDGDGVAELEHLLVAEHRPVVAIPLIPREDDEPEAPVTAVDVLVRHDLDHAGHPFSRARVDGEDLGMRDRGLYQGELKGVRRELEAQIGAVVDGAGGPSHTRRPRIVGVPDAPVGAHLGVGADVLDGGVAAHDLGSRHHRIHEWLVPGAAAHIVVLLEPVAHLLAAGRGIGVEQALRRDDESRRAEPALGAAVVDPGDLERMEIVGSPYPLDGCHLGVLGELAHLGDARAHHLAIEKHGAGAALAPAAAHLRPGEPQLLAQYARETIVGVREDVPRDSVDVQDHALGHTATLPLRIEKRPEATRPPRLPR